ncbi:MAG: hypothetical protein PHW82_12315 [Bacteroidales bacterium]|nr:hypothetical protein [Bacteroidales bacterium]
MKVKRLYKALQFLHTVFIVHKDYFKNSKLSILLILILFGFAGKTQAVTINFIRPSKTFDMIYIDCKELSNSQITAYPNPFDGKVLYLNSTSTLINSVINIYDALGRLAHQTKYEERNSHTELKIDD